MNALLDRLQPYPFERLRQLFSGVEPSPTHKGISLGIGEPDFDTPWHVRESTVFALERGNAFEASLINNGALVLGNDIS